MNDSAQQPWSEGMVVGLAVATAVMPLVGFISGFVGMNSPGKQDQGKGLFVWALLCGGFWLFVMANS